MHSVRKRSKLHRLSLLWPRRVCQEGPLPWGSGLQGDPDLKLTFDAPEKFLRFKCDVHPWMFAYVCVVDHPYFSVSGEDGTFKIENVPPGKYTLEATHRKVGTLTKEVEVKDEAVNLELTFKAE